MKQRTRIKICGITRPEDAQQVARRGADAIGLAFHRPSPRFIDLEAALEIRAALPPFITVTALFLDETEAWVEEVVEALRPDCLQFHGDESPEFCASWGRPYIKSVPMGSIDDPIVYADRHALAQGFLFDSNAAGRMGGSGDTFDWSRIPAAFDKPIILAGGINAANLAEAIDRVRPWAIDVSSAVESARGIKSSALIDEFFDAVTRAGEQPEKPAAAATIKQPQRSIV